MQAGPQRGSGNQLQYRSRGLPIRDSDSSTVEAERPTRGSFSGLSVCFAMYYLEDRSLVSKTVSKPQTKYSVMDIGLAARLASTS